MDKAQATFSKASIQFYSNQFSSALCRKHFHYLLLGFTFLTNRATILRNQYSVKLYFCKCFLLSGQEHPHVLNKHIPEKYWQHSSENDQKSVADDGGKRMFSCPLKCSSSFDDKVELLAHFKSVHGFSDDIIQKVLRAHPTLSDPLAVMEGAKKVEA